MATNNAVNNGLSGATGTGSFVGSTSPTFVTPNLGVATATSLVFNPTTGGIVGTTTNNNVVAGSVGEFLSSVVLSGSSVPYTNATPRDITSISLTAGDWDVYGNVSSEATGSTVIAFSCWISTTSATRPDGAFFNQAIIGIGLAGTTPIYRLNTPFVRASISSTTTFFLSARTDFSTTAVGFGAIYARRVR